jgi:hypothetical protein
MDKSTTDLSIASVRFVYNNDLVTKSMGYKHIGRLIRFADNKYTDCGKKVTDTDTLGDSDP